MGELIIMCTMTALLLGLTFLGPLLAILTENPLRVLTRVAELVRGLYSSSTDEANGWTTVVQDVLAFLAAFQLRRSCD